MSDKKDFSIIGKKVGKVDSKEKVTGEIVYANDFPAFPNTLHCKILRSPYGHAKIKNINTEKAKALEGVKAVITHADINKQFLHRGISAHPKKPRPCDSYIIEEEVRYIGDRVAAVAASSVEIAEEALRLIEVEYEELPVVVDPSDAIKPGAPKVHEFNYTPEGSYEIKNNVIAPCYRELGDIEKGFAEADYIFENEFKTGQMFNSPLGRATCLCKPMPNGGVEVWGESQGLHWSRMALSASLGLPLSKVRIHRLALGGAFGIYIYLRMSDVITAYLAMKTGLPVKHEDSRESMYYDGGRHPARIKLKTGVKKDGTVTAQDMYLLDGVGAYSSGTATLGLSCGWFLSHYRCPNKRFDGYAMYTNTPPLGSMRGAGNPETTLAMEAQADIICKELGIDPIDFRLKNITEVGRTYYGQGPDVYCTIKSCEAEQLIREGAKNIGWDTRGNHTPYPDKPWIKRGLGMAYGHHTSGTSSKESKTPSTFIIDYSGATIKMNEDGTANILAPTAECGGGAHTVDAMIAAEAIGIKYENVVIAYDTTSDATLWDHGSMASRHTVTMGNVLVRAGEQVKAGIIDWFNRMTDIPVDTVDLKNGEILVDGKPYEKLSYTDVLMFGQSQNWGTIYSTISYSSPACPPAFVVTFIEVEVDTLTGEVKVVKAFHSADVGTAINPPAVRGQLMGGLHMGIGYALSESVIYDSETGKVMNPSFVDYKLQTPVDMPKSKIYLAKDSYEPTGPYGAKGIGEAACNPVGAAVVNAIANALDKPLFKAPLTKEDVMRAAE